jgi:hypothetical protein
MSILCALFTLTLVYTLNAAPQLGVYSGAAPQGPINVNSYSAWLKKNVVYGLEFEADQTWTHIAGESWWLEPWSNWVNSAPGRTLIISIPMIPQAPASANIKDGANGAYNQYFTTLAQQLVKNKLASTILRIGWEFNGNWYRWSAVPGCNYWIQYFVNIVKVMKAVPGNQFKVIWNPNNGWTAVNATNCYPGNEYVDYVGIDCYDVDWSVYNWPINRTFGSWQSTTKYQPGDGVEDSRQVWKSDKDNTNVHPGSDSSTWSLLADASKLSQMQTSAWTGIYQGEFNIQYWTQFAKEHGKPVTLNEWGVWAQSHGGFDNDYYIQQMHNYISDPANNVAFYSYFDVFAFDGDHKLQPPTNFPLASQKFYSLFTSP